MKHKTLARIAVVMVIVFGLIVIAYPRIFAPRYPQPEDAPAMPTEAAPPAAPVTGP